MSRNNARMRQRDEQRARPARSRSPRPNGLENRFQGFERRLEAVERNFDQIVGGTPSNKPIQQVRTIEQCLSILESKNVSNRRISDSTNGTLSMRTLERVRENRTGAPKTRRLLDQFIDLNIVPLKLEESIVVLKNLEAVSLELNNLSNRTVLYKFRILNKPDYIVSDVYGLVPPRGTTEIQVLRRDAGRGIRRDSDRFQVAFGFRENRLIDSRTAWLNGHVEELGRLKGRVYLT